MEQVWPGQVVELHEDSFVARFETPRGPYELQVLFRTLTEDEVRYVQEHGTGAYVDYIVRRPAESSESSASVRLRRDRWTKGAIDAAQLEAEALDWFFNGDSAGRPTERAAAAMPLESDGLAAEDRARLE
jgi:hypothetical protein